MNKKTKYPQFSIKRLKKGWPFSLTLAKHIFLLNQFKLYSSVIDFFVSTALDLEDEEICYFRENKKLKKRVTLDSRYPGFFFKNNKMIYKESVKSKVKNGTKEELIIYNYNLDNIPYQTFVFEATKFYMNNFFQGAVLDLDIQDLKIFSLSLIWAPVFHYLLFTTCSSSMKNMLENQNYNKNHKGTILSSFAFGFKQLTFGTGSNNVQFKQLVAETERDFLKERLLNILDFSGISKNESETLITNFLLTENVDEIVSSYQNLISQLEENEVFIF